jgi:hypothetical protein
VGGRLFEKATALVMKKKDEATQANEKEGLVIGGNTVI